MNELTYTDYASFKAELDREIIHEAAGFVRIGYLLRLAQDTNILSESGYLSVNDFAKAEYGLDKSQVSRFMAINERFSEGGYSDRLEDKYQNFGVAKLSIMLQLPDAVNEQLTPDMTKAEINAVREEVKEEEKISDIEVMLEEKSEGSLLKQILTNVLEEHPDIYKKIWEENKRAQDLGVENRSKDFAEDVLAPSGEALYTTRISGIGKLMLTIRADKEKLIITNLRTGDTEEPEWDELGACLRFKCATSVETGYQMWFGKEFPKQEEKPQKAPAKVITTPKKEEKPKKEEAKVPESRINSKCEADLNKNVAAGDEKPEVAPVQQPESRINSECEDDFDEQKTEPINKPENMVKIEKEEDETEKELQNTSDEVPESRINSEYEADFEDAQIKALKNAMREEFNMAMGYLEINGWTSMIMKLEKIRNLAIQCRRREDELEDDEEDEEES